MFAASSSELFTMYVQIMDLLAKNGPQWMSHVSRIEALHHVSFINMTHVKSL